MISVNYKMKNHLIDSFDETDRKLLGMTEDIVTKMKKVNDCLIYDYDDELEPESVDYDKVVNYFKDRTGYESACNEIIIRGEQLKASQLILFLLLLGEEFRKKFTRKMIFYIYLKMDDYYELKFHSLWENENSLMEDNLDTYDQPMIRYIS